MGVMFMSVRPRRRVAKEVRLIDSSPGIHPAVQDARPRQFSDFLLDPVHQLAHPKNFVHNLVSSPTAQNKAGKNSAQVDIPSADFAGIAWYTGV
jgi:hypothetical protein